MQDTIKESLQYKKNTLLILYSSLMMFHFLLFWAARRKGNDKKSIVQKSAKDRIESLFQVIKFLVWRVLKAR
jgi:hypothetical protein